jgi:hypothetical protein
MEDRFAKAESGGGNPETGKGDPLTIRMVTGCGRNHGFQLVVDTQQVSILLKRSIKLRNTFVSSGPKKAFSRDKAAKKVFAEKALLKTKELSKCPFLWKPGLFTFLLLAFLRFTLHFFVKSFCVYVCSCLFVEQKLNYEVACHFVNSSSTPPTPNS